MDRTSKELLGSDKKTPNLKKVRETYVNESIRREEEEKREEIKKAASFWRVSIRIVWSIVRRRRKYGTLRFMFLRCLPRCPISFLLNCLVPSGDGATRSYDEEEDEKKLLLFGKGSRDYELYVIVFLDVSGVERVPESFDHFYLLTQLEMTLSKLWFFSLV